MYGLKWFLLQNKDLIVYKISSKRFNKLCSVINCISYRTKVHTTHDNIRTTDSILSLFSQLFKKIQDALLKLPCRRGIFKP